MSEADPKLPTETILTEEVAAEPRRRRSPWRLVIMLSVPILLLAVGGYFWLTSGRYVSTDNAYVQQDMVSVAPEVTGIVGEVFVHENQPVHRGDLLFRLDQRPFRIALVEFPAGQSEDWPSFYASHRLLPLAHHALSIERVCERIADLCGPAEPPARLHGDLWSGNVMGRYLIDPAAYGGHREIDLAMLQLFGVPGDRFFAAYEEIAPLADGWRDRVELYQLLPLLVHAEMFGGSYAAQAERAARRYVG